MCRFMKNHLSGTRYGFAMDKIHLFQISIPQFLALLVDYGPLSKWKPLDVHKVINLIIWSLFWQERKFFHIRRLLASLRHRYIAWASFGRLSVRREVTDYLKLIAIGLFMRWHYWNMLLFFSPKRQCDAPVDIKLIKPTHDLEFKVLIVYLP